MLAGRIGQILPTVRSSVSKSTRSVSSMLPTVSPTLLGKSSVTSSVEVDGVTNKAHWIRLKVLNWVDQEGRERKWEMAERKTTSKSGVDAVAIVSVLSHPTKPLSIPIVSLHFHPKFTNSLILVTDRRFSNIDRQYKPSASNYLLDSLMQRRRPKLPLCESCRRKRVTEEQPSRVESRSFTSERLSYRIQECVIIYYPRKDGWKSIAR